MQTSTKEATTVAASVAPEDLQCGDWVATLSEVVELPSFLWCDSALSDRNELIRVRFLPMDDGTPMKVKAICLPFVFVKLPWKSSETIDLRQTQLVRLNERYAKSVWKIIKKESARDKR